MSHLKSIEHNDDGTINITDDAGTKFINCYPTGVKPLSNLGDEIITIECSIDYDVVSHLKQWHNKL